MVQEAAATPGRTRTVNATAIKPTARIVSDDPVVVHVPKGFLFPIQPRGPVQIDVETLDAERYSLLVGGVGPLGGESNRLFAGLCMRHQRLILRLLLNGRCDAREIPVSYEDLITGQGGRQRTLMHRTIAELASSWVHKVVDNKVTSARLVDFDAQIYFKDGVSGTDLNEIHSDAKILRRHLKNVRFHEDFWRACLNWANCWQVRADVVGRMNSDLVAACYLVLTPRAYHPSITPLRKGHKKATDLLQEVGAVVPKHRSDLIRIFERQRGQTPSVLQQLNGAPTASGYLCVDEELDESADGKDLLVRFWVIKDIAGSDEANAFQERMRSRGALLEFWVGLGLSESQFDGLQHSEWRKLESYEEERINGLGYPVEKNRRYLELVRSFIGPVEFDVVIGSGYQAVNDAQTQDTNNAEFEKIRDHERWLGGAFRNAFKQFAKNFAGRSGRR